MPLGRINELFAPGVKPWHAHGIVISKRCEEKMHYHTRNCINEWQEGEGLENSNAIDCDARY